MNYYNKMVSGGELDGLDYLPTLPQLLRFAGSRYAEEAAIGSRESTYTYAQLVSRVKRRVAWLNTLGLAPGAHIAVLAPNDLNAMELFLAIPSAGFTVMMLPASLGGAALAGIVQRYDVACLLAADGAETAGVPCPVYGTGTLAPAEADFAPVRKETPAAIFLTGGTSGRPKGAVLSHGALLRGAYNGIFAPGSILRQRYMLLLPLSHVFGAIRSLLSCLYTGSFVYACPDLKAAVMELPVVRPTVLVLVPGMIELLLGIARLRGKAFLGDLRLIISGAAPVPPRLMQACREYAIQVCPGYGLTECANLTAGNADAADFPEAVGPAYPGQQVRVVDGELCIKGDNVMLGYYGEPELTAKVLVDGWFHTGDLAELREYKGEPFLVITGRVDNLILLGNGENVSPEALEARFYQEPLVKDCLVKPMIVNGNEVLGIEILPFAPALAGCSEEETRQKLQEVVDRINRTLPTCQQVAKLVVRTGDFKRSPAMKILRNQ